MEIKWIKNIPLKPEEFLHFFKKKYRLKSEEIFKLYHLTLKLTALSDVPIHKFLERIPCYMKFDELGKKKYLMTLSVWTFRNLVKEHLDLKFVKTLYLSLSKELPGEFLKGCAPKHSIVASQDVVCELLAEEEKAELPAYLKVKHLPLVFTLSGRCEKIINILPLLSIYTLRKEKKGYQVFFSLAISEFVVLALELKKIKKLREKIDSLLESLKILFPDCFGEL
jgi:hypothetical protein